MGRTALLYYNDCSLENDAKRGGAVAWIRKLQADGVPITGIGLQGHVRIDGPTAEKEAPTIEDFAALGIKVNISELDVDMLPHTTTKDSADVSTAATANANLYPPVCRTQRSRLWQSATLISSRCSQRTHESMGRVTSWGVSDGEAWLTNFPTRGRTTYPLLFDRRDKHGGHAYVEGSWASFLGYRKSNKTLRSEVYIRPGPGHEVRFSYSLDGQT